MFRLYERIFEKGGVDWMRWVAGGVIGTIAGLTAAGKSPGLSDKLWLFATGGALLGVLAVGLLSLVDMNRTRRRELSQAPWPKWKVVLFWTAVVSLLVMLVFAVGLGIMLVT